MFVANGHMKTVLKKYCMMLMEKNDFVQIVLFRRLLCSSCADLNFYTTKLYIVIKYVDAMNFKSADMKQSLEWWTIIGHVEAIYVLSIAARTSYMIAALFLRRRVE